MMQKCPQCGHDEFETEVAVVTTLYVQFFPRGEHEINEFRGGDADWDERSPARCLNPRCTWSGNVRELHVDEEAA